MSSQRSDAGGDVGESSKRRNTARDVGKSRKKTTFVKPNENRKRRGNEAKKPERSQRSLSQEHQHNYPEVSTADGENGSQGQYKNTSSVDLPSATSWPDDTTIPSRTQMEHGLLGLISVDGVTNTPHYGRIARELEFVGYGPTRTREAWNLAPSPGCGSTPMGRWMAERPSEQGALLARDDVSDWQLYEGPDKEQRANEMEDLIGT